MGPDGKVIMENSKERQLDSVFTAKVTGEYSFCFNNEMSTFAEKMVDFEIAVRGPPSELQTHAFSSASFMAPPDCLAMFHIKNMLDRMLMVLRLCRLKTNLPPPYYPPNKAPPLNKPPLWRSPS